MLKPELLKSYFKVTFVIVKILWGPFFIQAQSHSNSTSFIHAAQVVDSAKSDTALALAPTQDHISVISDTIYAFKDSKLEHVIAFYQYWNDQYPSPIIEYIYGMPNGRGYEIPRKQQSEDWKFYLSFFLLGLLALIRFGYSKEFDDLFSVFKNLGPSQQMFRELGTGVSFGTVLLNFFAVIVLSFYGFLLLNHYHFWNITSGLFMMGASLIVITLFLIVRYVSLKVASLLLPFRKEINLYNFYELQINRALGVVVFPFLLLIAFSKKPYDEYALYISLAMIIIFVFLRYIKGFNIGINYFGRHLFHFLLYICALEIAPVLIIIRLLQNLGSLRFSL